MTDAENPLEAISGVADELVPQLAERLRRHGLGEIEVRRGDLRLRVSAATGVAPAAAPQPASAASLDPSAAPGSPPEPAAIAVASPAVGFFVYADGLGPGLAVAKGDNVGHVEMLGVRHDVRAPRAGTVRNLVAESGEAVEYGQVVVELQAGEATL
ncbi:MAG TPA: biotin/lipoyl-containing protein [Candidatus Limnocylindria bacterium]|nr:biotin/lipoyl-containing protein [Candidatus Limnocylindria bacterium]